MFFKTWITESTKMLKQILADLFVVTRRTTKQMCQDLLKYMEPNGRGNDLKMASYNFLQNVAF